jgi:hypothetical protein
VKDVSHQALCDAAVRWLYGTMNCNVALSGIASTREIPDAIGWSTSWKHRGSILVECKRSLSDFHANKRKDHGNRMGNFRYFLVPDGLIPLSKVWDNHPEHGLLYLRRGRVSIISSAKENAAADLASENRLLQFAIVHIVENLLYAGCSVDVNTLTKSGVTNFHRDRYYGIEMPETPMEGTDFNRGECR